ncbi:MAG: hypothetical protein R3F34_07750 [Planctomycetota bacterium]
MVGQPSVGDHGTAWRDNARVQYNSCVFMDLGEQLVKFDNVDGDGGAGYGIGGTLSWADTWTTAASTSTNYQAQTSGNLAQITDSVFFRNLNGSAYTEATARGVFAAANDNVNAGSAAVDMPIRALTRAAAVSTTAGTVLPVAKIDPRPANAAVSAVRSAPSDGFFTPVDHRGAFGDVNWLCGWSAADAFGFLEDTDVVDVTADIATSTTWTADNVYNLTTQIYVLPGATLTIEAGTVIASDTFAGGSLAVTQGGKIIAIGTEDAPIVFTSHHDRCTWTDGTPRTGCWRPACTEWGNLTLMGKAYISENATPGNTNTFAATNYGTMEGLVPPVAHPEYARYGGGDDDDDSGTLRYVSLRYGGKVVAVGDELNGLSMGGIGRGTDVKLIEIMNNVDDGIETWGGTVNYKWISIWNVGDDSFDVDQGWRGKGQFIFIVQGYSCDDAQGSGVGDNCFETDGAEQSDYEPVTTAALWNCTVIGQPSVGDHGTAWRDNARVQYNSCIFMDLGEQLVKFDNVDGDGGAGYGIGGTLSWADTWTTAASTSTNYQAQTSGNLAQITDSVFFRNLNGSAYTEATARSVFAAANNNVDAGSLAADLPIRSLTRGTPVSTIAGTVVPVATVDPRPANAAFTSVRSAPADGFFSPVGLPRCLRPSPQLALRLVRRGRVRLPVVPGRGDRPR